MIKQHSTSFARSVTTKLLTGRAKGKMPYFSMETVMQWLHIWCAGLSQSAFQKFSNADGAFFCPRCHLDRHESTIKDLLDTIKSLEEYNLNIKEKDCVQSSPSPPSNPDSTPSRSFASVVVQSASQQSVPNTTPIFFLLNIS